MQAHNVGLSQNAIQGLKSFNHQQFYKAHEGFESAWRESPDETREFYRALLQLSGGYFRLTQGRAEAAHKFFTRALNWLEPFPNPYKSIDTDQIRHALKHLVEAINDGQPPKLIVQSHFHPIEYTS
jgi:predicted metal-dependent hydrolase